MRNEVAEAIKGLLLATGQFGAVLGLGSDKPSYPLARVWVNGSPRDNNINGAPNTLIDLRVAVQIETHLGKDDDGNSIDATLYGLVDTAFDALHNAKLPGRGSLPLIVYDHPGLGAYSSDGPAVYTMQVSARVMPETFSLTI